MENLLLFNLQKESVSKNASETENKKQSGKLDIVAMEFKEVQSMTWQELFGGFDCLHAIVYSSSIKFVYQLLEQFEDAEILFGSEAILEYSFQEIMAYQCKTIERLRDTADKMKLDLVSRITDESLRLYVARDFFRMRRYIYYLPMMVENVQFSAPQMRLPDVIWKAFVMWMVTLRTNSTSHVLKR